MKKEPEPQTETVKQEEREPATKSSAPAHQANRLLRREQGCSEHTHAVGGCRSKILSPTALLKEQLMNIFFFFL